MTSKAKPTKEAPQYDEHRMYHVHVSPGRVVQYDVGGVVLSFGDRATLQVPGYDVEYVTSQGAYVVEPDKVPDVGSL